LVAVIITYKELTHTKLGHALPQLVSQAYKIKGVCIFANPCGREIAPIAKTENV